MSKKNSKQTKTHQEEKFPQEETKSQNKEFLQKDKIAYFVLIILLLLFGNYLRSHNLASRGLEYDEIWNIHHYAMDSLYKIFSDVSSPNNHVLHTLNLWVCLRLFGDSALSIRLNAFLFGCGILWLVFISLALKQKHISIIILALSWLIFSPHLVHYAQTARGYSMQIFWIVLHASLLWHSEFILTYSLKSKTFKNYWPLCIGIILSGFFAVVTFPTAILYIAPVTLFHISYLFNNYLKSQATEKKIFSLKILRYSPLFSAHIITLFLCGIWTLINFFQMYQWQQERGAVRSFQEFYSWAISTGKELFPLHLIFLVILALFVKTTRLCSIIWLILIGFISLTSVISGVGPTRVYLYTLPFFYVAAAEGVYAGYLMLKDWLGKLNNFQIKNETISNFTPNQATHNKPVKILNLLYSAIIILLVCFPVQNFAKKLKNVEPEDWTDIVPTLEKSLSKDIYIAYPVFSGLQIRYYFFPEICFPIQRLPKEKKHFLAIDGFTISGTSCKDELSRYIPINKIILKKEIQLDDKIFQLLELEQKTLADNIWEKSNLSGLYFLSIGPIYNPIEFWKNFKPKSDWVIINLLLSELNIPNSNDSMYGYFLVCENPDSQELAHILKQHKEDVRLYSLKR